MYIRQVGYFVTLSTKYRQYRLSSNRNTTNNKNNKNNNTNTVTMGAGAGFALKVLQWFNRGVQFCCAGLILSLTSYFLAAMSNHDIAIPNKVRATEGISGVAVLYSGLGVLLVCCLAGFTLTSFLAMLLDVAFVGAFIYVATVYKDGTSSCSGSNVQTVFGTGDANTKVSTTSDGGVPLPTFRTACKMQSAMLAVAIVAM